MSLRVGIDIGSTTVKVVVLDEQNKLLFRSYERHYSKTRERACETLRSISDMLSGQNIKVTITGSAGLGVATASGIDFVQEVYATAAAVAYTSCTKSTPAALATPSPAEPVMTIFTLWPRKRSSMEWRVSQARSRVLE